MSADAIPALVRLVSVGTPPACERSVAALKDLMETGKCLPFYKRGCCCGRNMVCACAVPESRVLVAEAGGAGALCAILMDRSLSLVELAVGAMRNLYAGVRVSVVGVRHCGARRCIGNDDIVRG